MLYINSCSLARIFHYKPGWIFIGPLDDITPGSPSQTMQYKLVNDRILVKLFISMRLFSPSNNETFVNFQDLIKRQSKMDLARREQGYWCGCQTLVLSKVTCRVCYTCRFLSLPAGAGFRKLRMDPRTPNVMEWIEEKDWQVHNSWGGEGGRWWWWNIFKLGYCDGCKIL